VQRNSDQFFCFLLIGVFLISLMFIDASVSQGIDKESLRERREIVKVLTLTDLCLFTEARYTRHPSMADMHTPFQEHPLSLEHFPSGSIIVPPPQLRSRAAR
jgi:hypothetical protein